MGGLESLSVTLLQLLLLLLSAGFQYCLGQTRPHIVLIVADDLGWNDVGFHGSEIKTPNIDRLAYDGVIFNNYYVSPICTPTRGSLMTGRHPIHLGYSTGQNYRVVLSFGLWKIHTEMKIAKQSWVTATPMMRNVLKGKKMVATLNVFLSDVEWAYINWKEGQYHGEDCTLENEVNAPTPPLSQMKAFDGPSASPPLSQIESDDGPSPNPPVSQIETIDGPSPTSPVFQIETIDGPSPTSPVFQIETIDGPSPTSPVFQIETVDGPSPTSPVFQKETVDGPSPIPPVSKIESVDGPSPTSPVFQKETVDGPSPIPPVSKIESVDGPSPTSPVSQIETIDRPYPTPHLSQIESNDGLSPTPHLSQIEINDGPSPTSHVSQTESDDGLSLTSHVSQIETFDGVSPTTSVSQIESDDGPSPTLRVSQIKSDDGPSPNLSVLPMESINPPVSQTESDDGPYPSTPLSQKEVIVEQSFTPLLSQIESINGQSLTLSLSQTEDISEEQYLALPLSQIESSDDEQFPVSLLLQKQSTGKGQYSSPPLSQIETINGPSPTSPVTQTKVNDEKSPIPPFSQTETSDRPFPTSPFSQIETIDKPSPIPHLSQIESYDGPSSTPHVSQIVSYDGQSSIPHVSQIESDDGPSPNLSVLPMESINPPVSQTESDDGPYPTTTLSQKEVIVEQSFTPPLSQIESINGQSPTLPLSQTEDVSEEQCLALLLSQIESSDDEQFPVSLLLQKESTGKGQYSTPPLLQMDSTDEQSHSRSFSQTESNDGPPSPSSPLSQTNIIDGLSLPSPVTQMKIIDEPYPTPHLSQTETIERPSSTPPVFQIETVNGPSPTPPLSQIDTIEGPSPPPHLSQIESIDRPSPTPPLSQKESDDEPSPTPPLSQIDTIEGPSPTPPLSQSVTVIITESVVDSDNDSVNSDIIPLAPSQRVKMTPKLAFPEFDKHFSSLEAKTSQSESDIDDEEIEENDILRDVTNPRLFVKKVSQSVTTKGGKLKKDERVYNSYHYCSYCKKLVSNFSQHLKRKHNKKEAVKSAFDTENTKSRKNKLFLLCAKMDNEFNNENIAKGKGEVLLFRRPSAKFDLTAYGPCPKCLFWVSKKMMHRHLKSCVAGGENMTQSEVLTRSDILSGRIQAEASPALSKEVFSTMQNDTIGVIARNDPLIVSLGNMWLEKNVSNKLKRGKYTSQIMRLVARLLTVVREDTRTNFSLCEYIKPSFFNDMVKATLKIAGNNPNDPEYLENPSNAVKLGHDLKRICSINIANSIMIGDDKRKKDSEDFLQTMKVLWGTRVTKLARSILTERQFNKRVVLPETGDIQKLNDFLNSELNKMDTKQIDVDNYTYVAKLLCTKLVQYNRRRPGEIEAITLNDYHARETGGKQSSIVGELTVFERHLLEKQDVVTVRGKGHRGVPVIIPAAAKKGMQYIATMTVRRQVGIDHENRYLFASAGGARDVLRVYDALADFCGKANLSSPERITATTLRKYMATITQVLDLQPHQLDWVVRHMGHSLDIHKIYYRCTSDVIERTQVAKILLLQDCGRLPEFANKSLAEIQLEGLQHYVISAPEPWGLPLNYTTMPQHLKHLGYATHIVGKWHLGFFKEEYIPTSRGFDSHFGYWTGKEDYYNHLDQDVYWGLDFRRNLDVINGTFYSTEEYTKEAVSLIDAHNKSQPLFLYLAHQAVHAGNGNHPLQAPQQYVDRFPYIQNTRRRTFAGMVAALDDSVGDVVRVLNHRGMMDNTIIVFTTDNGGPANNYDGNAACNLPLRGTKNTLWEGGVHGVGFVHSPLLKKRHVKSDGMLHVSDWLPTLYSAAGGEVSELGAIDGIDQWPAIQSDGPSPRKEILHNIDPKSKFSAIRMGEYKLIQGLISGHRDDSWYPCNPPKLDRADFDDHHFTTLDLETKQGVYVKATDTSESLNRGLRHSDIQMSPIVSGFAEKVNMPFGDPIKSMSPHTPYVVDCGNIPKNYTNNCFPEKTPCLFHIPSDPCEYFNIADANPAIVQTLLRRIDELSATAVDPVNQPIDKLANPSFHNGIWVPWQGK